MPFKEMSKSGIMGTEFSKVLLKGQWSPFQEHLAGSSGPASSGFGG